MKDLKMMIVMRKDLNMRKGKMIAQGAHAAVTAAIFFQGESDFETWFDNGQKKIAVSVDSEEELIQVYQAAVNKKLNAKLITDAGHTEFKGVPTKTCCAIGPATDADLQSITGELKLL